MHNPIAISNYFIQKSLNDGNELTPMKLMKLAYISHGWHLALTDGEGAPLLPEFVYAWKYGPVVKSIYDTFKKYGKDQITAFQVDGEGTIPHLNDENTTKLLDKIWDLYKLFTGPQLSTLTHEEGSPWDIVWNTEGGKFRLNAVIRNELIRDFYRGKIVE